MRSQPIIKTRTRYLLSKGKKVKLSLYRPIRGSGGWGSEFVDNRLIKVVTLSALSAGRLYTPGKIPGTHFCQILDRPQGPSAAEGFRLMRGLSGRIRNRASDLPACGALPEPNAASRTPTSPQVHVGMFISQLRQLVFGFVDYLVTSRAHIVCLYN
jgi:hypothetical protein